MSLWTQISGYSFGTFEERQTLSLALPLVRGDATLISGKLPRGLRLENNTIVGTPFEVERTTKSRFVLRASDGRLLEDRTFNIVIEGADDPVFVTAEGLLPVGSGQQFYILDNEPCNFQIEVIDPDLPAGDELQYYIRPGDGELPPGLQLTQEGQIVGVVEPLLALDKFAGNGFYDNAPYDVPTGGFDFGVLSGNGFESYFYDSVLYDTSTVTRTPRKLNRTYEFIVSVTDGEVEVSRKFKIYVVGDDFLRADNTIVRVANGLYTADATFVRTPIWLTPANLGFKRAANYVTLFLDTLDTNTLAGVTSYELLSNNPDSSPSTLPPGTSLDALTGEIAGRVPYQPAVTIPYKFTVRARRNFSTGDTAYKDKTFTVNLLGEVDSTIKWLSDSDLGTIQANFISTLSVLAETNVPDARLIYSLDSGRLPPGLSLAFDGEIIGKVKQFGSADVLGLTVIDSDTTTFDGATTSIDRDYTFTVTARDRFGYSAISKTFKISVNDPNDNLYSNILIQPFMTANKRSAFTSFIGNPNTFPPEYIYRPNDPEFGLQPSVKILAYPGIITENIDRYVAAASKYHSKSRFKSGEVKVAVAKQAGSNEIVYEVVYVEVLDPRGNTNIKTRDSIKIDENASITVDSLQYEELDNSKPVESNQSPIKYRPNGNTIKTDSDAVRISDPDSTYKYVSNIENMRRQISEIGETERGFLPLWMRTAQEGDIQELGFTLAYPLCFCKPGTGNIIKNNIKLTEFDFKSIDLTIDRYIIDSTTGNSNEQYIVFGNYSYNT